MNNNSNFFESWLETQTKLAENWTKSVSELQQNFLGGQAFQKGSEMYKDWLNNQGFKHTFEDNFNNESHQAESKNGYLDQLMDLQKKAFTIWSDAGKNFTKVFLNGESNNWVENTLKTQEAWINLFRTNLNPIGTPEGYWNVFSGKTMNSGLESLQKGTEAYTRFFELWKPVFSALQQGNQSAEGIRKLLDPSLYRAYMDKLFGYNAGTQFRGINEELYKLFASYFHDNVHNYQSIYQQWKENGEKLSSAFTLNTDNFKAKLNEAYGQFRKSLTPFMKIYSGKEAEQTILTDELFQDNLLAAEKIMRLQYLMYITGAEALEKLADRLVEKTKSDQRYDNFTEFYKEWIDISSNAFEGFFATDEFSKLQGELITLDANIRKNANKQMENFFASYPLVVRSEMDEVYKTNYELKKRIHDLEKQLVSLKNSSSPKMEVPVQEKAEVKKALKK